MTKDQFIEHGFAVGDAVRYKGQDATVVSVHINDHGWKHLVVAFGASGRPGRHHSFAACGPEDIELIDEKKMLYSVLEQHADGSWWYHPGFTRETRAEAELKSAHSIWWDLERPRSHRTTRSARPTSRTSASPETSSGRDQTDVFRNEICIFQHIFRHLLPLHHTESRGGGCCL